MAVTVWRRARGREVRVRVTAAMVTAEQARGRALMIALGRMAWTRR
jgi:hypothetical protein